MLIIYNIYNIYNNYIYVTYNIYKEAMQKLVMIVFEKHKEFNS